MGGPNKITVLTRGAPCTRVHPPFADGTVVERCLEFRNRFHLLPYATATLFVPCGGRPEAVNISNVTSLFHADGKPRFSYVVEGANLFFTQPARLYLESRGVLIFKDASANKGGVTSSSLEVLAALAFTDEEFHEHMQVSGRGRGWRWGGGGARAGARAEVRRGEGRGVRAEVRAGARAKADEGRNGKGTDRWARHAGSRYSWHRAFFVSSCVLSY